MQRFTKEMIKSGFDHEQRHSYGERYQRCADHRRKFVYGANGTLTQAAQYRLTAIVNLARYPGQDVSAYRKHLAAVRHMMDCSRRGGCRLPE